MDYLAEYERWLKEADAETVKELEAIRGDEEEIKDRFYKTLEFGTAGLRGVLGAGTNRMNEYVVGQATQGLANQLIKTNGADADLSVVIAYDSRHKSDVFSKEAAQILAANGIKTYLFEELKPVPELSFSVGYLKTTAGIAVTASHNPAKYNGYKAYGADGAQLNPELAAKEKGDTLKFVYTPFHGAGNKPVRKILKRIGFNNVVVVKEQELPDGDFPTVEFPNPEYKEGFHLAIGYAKECGADLIVGTDPDSDRVGILVKNDKGEYVNFTGNQVGALLSEYILSALKEKNAVPKDGYIVKTIVTTNIVKAICDAYGIGMKEVLTGFKFIGEKIKESEETGVGTYLFGFEESYGYLKGTYARDKDAVVATMLIAEMALYYQEKGSSIFEQMDKIYKKYGYYKEQVVSVTLEGIEGLAKIKSTMDKIRSNPPKSVAGKKVIAIRDYLTSERVDLKTGEKSEILLPQSNVIYLELEDQNNFIIRPSGTEPKIKVYCLMKGETEEEANELLEKVKADVDAIVK